MNLLRVYQGVLKPKKGRINKIGSGGEFGDLVIHLPGLLTYRHLKVFVNGKKVMDETVDQDTIDLLMKRLDKKKHYSSLSHKIFDKLIELNDVVDNELDDNQYSEPDDETDDNQDDETPYFKKLKEKWAEESM